MNRKIAFSLASAALLFTTPAHASSLTGVWNTGSEGGKVQIYRCGDALCGKIVDAARLRRSCTGSKRIRTGFSQINSYN